MAQTTLTFDVQKRKRQRTKFLSGAVYYVGVTALALLMLYPVAGVVAPGVVPQCLRALVSGIFRRGGAGGAARGLDACVGARRSGG